MKFSKQDILKIAPDLILQDHIEGNPVFDWIDIVGIPQRPVDLKNSLYFATYSDGENDWYYPFDRRKIASKVQTDKGWYLAVEEGTPINLDGDYIVVSSLEQLAQRLFEKSKMRSHAKVIGVTGSVGKTTTVALLEHLLLTAEFKTVRFWSKRITPLSLYCHFINRVEEDTDFITLEYSAYFPNNVLTLAKLLPVDYAFFINICEMHINPHTFKNIDEVINSKLHIKGSSTNAFLNRTIVNKMTNSKFEDWEKFSVSTHLKHENPAFPPTLRSAEMQTVAEIVAKELNIQPSILQKTLNTFEPKERRIPLVTFNDTKLFFDGEASVGGRLWSWFETLQGKAPIFLVDHVVFGDEDPAGFLEFLNKIYSAPQTYVLDTQHNRDVLPVHANFLSLREFGAVLLKSKGEYVVYHKGLSTRQPEFDPASYLKEQWL